MLVWLTLGFLAFIVVLVALDLGVQSRRPRHIAPAEAAASFALWVLTAAAIGLVLAVAYEQGWLGPARGLGVAESGGQAALQFAAAYLSEVALSLDNIAVLALVFEMFAVRPALRNRLLFWTILVSILVRAGLILLGSAALAWPPTVYVFAGILGLATLRTLLLSDRSSRFDRQWLVRMARRIPVGDEGEGHRLTTRADGRLRGTPMLRVVLVAAAADLTLAIDSVPAAFAVTGDALVALTTNILALLALRSLYFWLTDVIARLRFIRISLFLVLLTLTVKTLTGRFDAAATIATLSVVGAVMAAGIVASMLRPSGAGPLRLRPTPLEDVAAAAAITRRNFRKVVILIAGTFVLLLAVVLGPLPGPWFVVFGPLGLAILATEFIWARRLLQRLRAQSESLQRHAGSMASRTPLWVVPLGVAGYWAGAAVLAVYLPLPALMFWPSAALGFLPVAYWAWAAIAAARARRRIAAEPSAGGSAGPAELPGRRADPEPRPTVPPTRVPGSATGALDGGERGL